MNKEKFLSLDISNISQVYEGKQNHCRCGCGGDYISTSYMKEPRSNVDDQSVLIKLQKAQKLVREGVKVSFGENYIDVTVRYNRTLTFYIDDLK